MPELPEVETIRRDLETRVLHKKIVSLDVIKAKIVKSDPKEFKRILTGNSLTKFDRIGKLIIASLQTGDLFLLMHLKMTGRLIYREGKDIIAGGHSLTIPEELLSDKHRHILFTFSDKSTLEFEDMRQFGYMKLVSEKEVQKIKSQFGIEPLTKEFTLSKFKEIFQKRKAPLKAVLLNQALIAGVGNIYADEICFLARILPGRSVAKLTAREIENIFQATNRVIKDAVKHRGTTFYSYVDGKGEKGSYFELLKVYERKGKPCLVCGTPIVKIRLAGRGTHFCPACQK